MPGLENAHTLKRSRQGSALRMRSAMNETMYAEEKIFNKMTIPE